MRRLKSSIPYNDGWMNTMDVRFSRWMLLVAGLTLFASPRQMTAQSALDDGGLQAGDVVVITVWQREELSGEFTVAPDGSLDHPLYRQVRVTGIPTGQVEARVREFLTAYEANPQIVVQPMYKVAVSGPVMRPDIYSLPPGTTVAQAVTRAGGVTEQGKRDEVELVRNGREIELDLTEAEAMQMPVQSGDLILVKSSGTTRGFTSVVLPLIQIVAVVVNVVSIATR